MTPRALLAAVAAAEAVTGLALMVVPALVVRLLLGAALDGAGIAVGRVAGISLLALSVACWPGREAERPADRALVAMLGYSLLITFYLGYVAVARSGAGPLLWPAVGVHAAITVLLAWARLRR